MYNVFTSDSLPRWHRNILLLTFLSLKIYGNIGSKWSRIYRYFDPVVTF